MSEKSSNTLQNKLPSILADCIKEIKLKNGMTLKLSTLDAKHLGMWTCLEKRHRKCQCKLLKKYGKVDFSSEWYLKPKSRSVVFDEK